MIRVIQVGHLHLRPHAPICDCQRPGRTNLYTTLWLWAWCRPGMHHSAFYAGNKIPQEVRWVYASTWLPQAHWPAAKTKSRPDEANRLCRPVTYLPPPLAPAPRGPKTHTIENLNSQQISLEQSSSDSQKISLKARHSWYFYLGAWPLVKKQKRLQCLSSGLRCSTLRGNSKPHRWPANSDLQIWIVMHVLYQSG